MIVCGRDQGTVVNNTVWKTGGQGYGTQVLLHAIFVEGARLLLTLTIGRVSSVGTASERRGGYKRQPMRCIVISTEPIRDKFVR